MRRDNDPVWLEQQYNARAAVPEHPLHFQKWAAASAHVRANARCVLDLPYGDGPGETLDVFPGDAAGAPVLVFVHGGYWRGLDKSEHSFIAPVFTAAGALVVVPNYALVPAVSIEQITLQVARAVEWSWRHAAEYGGDPSRIVVAGHSAGGHLTAMMLSCRWKEIADDLPAQLVRAGLAISGLYDLEPLRHVPSLQDLGLTPASVKRLSPAFFPRPKGRLIAVAGGLESDEFRRQTQLIRDVWGPTAVPVSETIPGVDHFTILRELVDPAARLHALARGLLGLK
ncbi:MAG TPA: alpha/beta hydrolase [Rubrivivax sp.]|nr:alpha/beta hydrolase [Rubrivivax sp.]